jgi:hypothetical protein
METNQGDLVETASPTPNFRCKLGHLKPAVTRTRSEVWDQFDDL